MRLSESDRAALPAEPRLLRLCDLQSSGGGEECKGRRDSAAAADALRGVDHREMGKVVVDAKQPIGCTDAEIAAFCRLVRHGDEVQSAGLEDRVRAARALVFLYVDGTLVGVAALKTPSKTYRDDKFPSKREEGNWASR